MGAVGCSPYASLWPSLFFPHIHYPCCAICTSPFLFLPACLTPPPHYSQLSMNMLVRSISCLACLGHLCNAAFICFTESRPQQWALTGLSVMLGPVIDLIRATRELENKHTVCTQDACEASNTHQPSFLHKSWHQGKSEAVKVKWTEFLSRLRLIKMKQFPARFLFQMWALTVKALLFTLI